MTTAELAGYVGGICFIGYVVAGIVGLVCAFGASREPRSRADHLWNTGLTVSAWTFLACLVGVLVMLRIMNAATR